MALHNLNKQDALGDFLTARLNTKVEGAREEHPSDKRERERNEALIERARTDEVWRTYTAQYPEASQFSGDTLRELRTACNLSQGDVARILAVDPQTVASAERAAPGQVTYAQPVLAKFVSAARAVLVHNGIPVDSPDDLDEV